MTGLKKRPVQYSYLSPRFSLSPAFAYRHVRLFPSLCSFLLVSARIYVGDMSSCSGGGCVDAKCRCSWRTCLQQSTDLPTLSICACLSGFHSPRLSFGLYVLIINCSYCFTFAKEIALSPARVPTSGRDFVILDTLFLCLYPTPSASVCSLIISHPRHDYHHEISRHWQRPSPSVGNTTLRLPTTTTRSLGDTMSVMSGESNTLRFDYLIYIVYTLSQRPFDMQLMYA